MCRCLQVSPSGYYEWRERLPSTRSQENSRLSERIVALHAQSDGVMGSPRIWEELRYTGETCGRHRVARLMRRMQLYGIPQKRKARCMSPGNRPAGIQNHLERDFTADQANAKWVTDITYIRTQERWLYLCVVIDLYSGMVIGWSMSSTQDRHLVIQSVLMALWQRHDQAPVILHSDCGCQFTSDDYQRFLTSHHITFSMSAVGSCADNAATEGFFGLLKRERVYRRQYRTLQEARTDIFDYIERFHNPRMKRKIQMRQFKDSRYFKPSGISG